MFFQKRSIYIVPKNYIVTIEIRIQGGIVAARVDVANGITSIFMVQSVMATPKLKKTKQEYSKSSYSHSDSKPEQSFNRILDQAIEEQDAAPVICHTSTYGQDCRMQTFHYQSREYHY